MQKCPEIPQFMQKEAKQLITYDSNISRVVTKVLKNTTYVIFLSVK